MPPKKKEENPELVINKIDVQTCDLYILGSTPLIYNRVSEKAKHELLMPRATGKLNAAEKASRLKHVPLQEFRDSMYTYIDDARPTRLRFPSAAPKKSMSTAALDLPGLKRAQIGRLVWVNGTSIDIYGIPQVLMSVVRSADIGRTPDIRSRAILPEWACRISVSVVSPILKAQQIANLLAAAGLLCGLGDWRQERGSGNFGQFSVTTPDDPNYLRIVSTQGREAQDAAIANPAPFDDETQEMLGWFESELARRQLKAV